MAADSIVGEARHAAPHDRMTGQRIIGAGEMTAEPRDLSSQTQTPLRPPSRRAAIFDGCG
jgi:hypothetical protein